MSVPCEMLLHPELLTNEQLIFIIQERHLHIPDMERMPRDELLEIFHHYCVPFGQRKYRDSGRGKILNRTRHLSPEPKPASFNVINSHSFIITNNQHRKQLLSNCDRLKPPPDLLSGHMKRIKIENNTTHLNLNVINSKRRMSIDSVPPADAPSPKKQKKPITWP